MLISVCVSSMYKLTLRNKRHRSFWSRSTCRRTRLRSGIKETPSVYMKDDLCTTSSQVSVFAFICNPSTYVAMTVDSPCRHFFDSALSCRNDDARRQRMSGMHSYRHFFWFLWYLMSFSFSSLALSSAQVSLFWPRSHHIL